MPPAPAAAARRVLVGALACFALAACTRRAPAPLPPATGPAPEQESWDVDLLLTEDGRPRARVRAAYFARFEADTVGAVFLPDAPDADEAPGPDTSRVRADVFDEAGAPRATVWAGELRHDEQLRRFRALGGVEVRTATQKRLVTERLDWDEAGGALHTDAFVRITGPGEDIRGYGLDADEGLDSYTIRRVTGTATYEEEE